MNRRSGRRSSRKRSDSGRSEEQRKTNVPRRMRNKLFVGNLGRVSKLELQDEFGRFGRLQDVWVSHKPAGFAFVEFLNSKDASECVQALDGRNILGGRLRVEFAKTETAFPAHRKASSRSRSSRPSRRKSPSRGLGDLMLGSSSTRLLPPPKASASMLAPVYSRSPSPLVLLRRGSGGLFYEDRAVYRTWDDATRLPHTSSSLLLPSIRNRSRSPRPRSPLPPPPPVVDRDLLSSSGRLLAPPAPSSYPSASYIGSRSDYTPPHIRRYSRERSPVRYKSRSPLPPRSRSPVRALPESLKHIRPRSASQSPKVLVTHRPREHLLGKTPPPLPSRSLSASPPRYSNISAEAPVTRGPRERSRSPLAYSSRKPARPYSPPSSRPEARNSYEKKFSASPVRKRNSPPPKAYALSSDKNQSRVWSRSRSRSVGVKYSSSRSPVHRMDNRTSSSTSPPHYGGSPVAHDSRPPIAIKRETLSPDGRQKNVMRSQRSSSLPRRDNSPVQRYSRTYTSSKQLAGPKATERDRSPHYHRTNSPPIHSQVSRHRASPEAARPKLESYRTARSPLPDTETGVCWSAAPKRSDRNRKQSPPVASSARNGRSVSGLNQTMSGSDRGRNSTGVGRVESSPVSRDRHSPRRRR